MSEIGGGLALVLVRGLSVAALLCVAGTLLVRCLTARGAGAAAERGLLWLGYASILAYTIAALAWLLAQTAVFVDAETARDVIDALPSVAGDTLFGRVLLLRLGVVGLVALTLRYRAALPLALFAAALQAGHSHAASMTSGPSLLLGSQVLHLLAASCWLGALPGLLLVITLAPPAIAARTCRRFSIVGTLSVMVVIATAGFQYAMLIGSVPALVGTAAGQVAMLKIAMFGALLVLALLNRFRFGPRLAATGASARPLARSVGLEAIGALVLVLAASTLASLPPAHSVQPVWPSFLRLATAQL
jgi:putative copper export protein